jgi:hypothetical protein
MKNLFCKLYALVLSKVFDQQTDPLVRLYNALIGSSCKYCMATRAGMIGLGVGMFNLYGLALIALAVGFTVGERRWLCDVPAKS